MTETLCRLVFLSVRHSKLLVCVKLKIVLKIFTVKAFVKSIIVGLPNGVTQTMFKDQKKYLLMLFAKSQIVVTGQ